MALRIQPGKRLKKKLSGHAEEILAKLEDEEIGLEASFQLYQEGMKLLKSCNAAVDKVEKKLIILEEEASI